MYHVCVHELARRIAEYVRRNDLLKPGDRVGVAVSGGADSVALLRLLLELRTEMGIVLSVVHFNHNLRGTESDADQQFVQDLARQHGLTFHCGSGTVQSYAAEKHLSIETAARELRYQYFSKLLESALDRVATAHTLDDQAETVLLRLVRGTGNRGLGGIYPRRLAHAKAGEVGLPAIQPEIIRPLLGVRRSDLEPYLSSIGQTWREDASNRDLRHARNRMRHGILPRLERHFNPQVREALSETAEIARAEEEYWEAELGRVLPQVWSPAESKTLIQYAPLALQVHALRDLPVALQRRVICAAAESCQLRLEFRQVEEVRALVLATPGSGRIDLGDDWRAVRDRGELGLVCVAGDSAADYEYELPIPGLTFVPELGTTFEAQLVQHGLTQGYNSEHLFSAEDLESPLLVRNWRAGDRFRPVHRKSAKKIKELLQELRVTGPDRKRWPVVISKGEVVWVRGLPSSERFRPEERRNAIVIREIRPRASQQT
jgi:tRNA(Ile)-lysidine synthase